MTGVPVSLIHWSANMFYMHIHRAFLYPCETHIVHYHCDKVCLHEVKEVV